MTERNIIYDTTSFSPQRSQELPLLKSDSFIYNYNEAAELEEIGQDQLVFNKEFQEYQEILFENEWSKKNYFQKSFSKYSDDSNISGPSTQFCQSCQQQNCICSQFCQKCQCNICNCSTKKKKFLDKSYCRYILLYVFRTIENQQYAQIIRDICCKFQVNYDDFKSYYKKQRLLTIGYQSLKKELIYDNDDIADQNRKKAFKNVLQWYLDKVATKHILLSKKQNFQGYLKFKNYVLSYYIHDPKNWVGNKPSWK
ncbi:unnamed protein product [Paramecium sonneborni]|uniref:Uncharacterized protein n=1 Tax=Paramecium sonneborni TaxID=65129 RepID=A0A8S1R5T0_9CILI|nr:unnamed protein product [Paramecium sonneborni]